MTFEEATRAAAKRADDAARWTIARMNRGRVHDEDDITSDFATTLEARFNEAGFDGVQLGASVVRHRAGKAAEERRVGADLLIHVSMDTPTQKYSKGVLVQAKKASDDFYWSPRARARLNEQCETMLSLTPAAFVFNYDRRGLRCGAASRVVGAGLGQGLNYLCHWTCYRFFLELFRCPVGDTRITSPLVTELPIPQPPVSVALTFTGELALEEGSSL